MSDPSLLYDGRPQEQWAHHGDPPNHYRHPASGLYDGHHPTSGKRQQQRQAYPPQYRPREWHPPHTHLPNDQNQHELHTHRPYQYDEQHQDQQFLHGVLPDGNPQFPNNYGHRQSNEYYPSVPDSQGRPFPHRHSQTMLDPQQLRPVEQRQPRNDLTTGSVHSGGFGNSGSGSASIASDDNVGSGSSSGSAGSGIFSASQVSGSFRGSGGSNGSKPAPTGQDDNLLRDDSIQYANGKNYFGFTHSSTEEPPQQPPFPDLSIPGSSNIRHQFTDEDFNTQQVAKIDRELALAKDLQHLDQKEYRRRSAAAASFSKTKKDKIHVATEPLRAECNKEKRQLEISLEDIKISLEEIEKKRNAAIEDYNTIPHSSQIESDTLEHCEYKLLKKKLECLNEIEKLDEKLAEALLEAEEQVSKEMDVWKGANAQALADQLSIEINRRAEWMKDLEEKRKSFGGDNIYQDDDFTDWDDDGLNGFVFTAGFRSNATAASTATTTPASTEKNDEVIDLVDSDDSDDDSLANSGLSTATSSAPKGKSVKVPQKTPVKKRENSESDGFTDASGSNDSNVNTNEHILETGTVAEAAKALGFESFEAIKSTNVIAIQRTFTNASDHLGMNENFKRKGFPKDPWSKSTLGRIFETVYGKKCIPRLLVTDTYKVNMALFFEIKVPLRYQKHFYVSDFLLTREGLESRLIVEKNNDEK